MSYTKITAVSLIALLVGGCGHGIQTRKAGFSTFDGAKVINRALITRQADNLYSEGYRGTRDYSDFSEEEFFEAVKKELKSEYNRIYNLDHAACNQHAQQVFNKVRPRPINPYAPLQYGNQTGLWFIRTFEDSHHKVAAEAYDACMFHKEWEPGTQADFDEAAVLALTRAKKRSQKAASLAAQSSQGGNIAAHVFEQTWRSVVVIKSGSKQGSGVIVRPNAVATNCHVVDEGGSIAVYKTGDKRALTESAYPATISKRDDARDFCLLNVSGLWGIPANIRAYHTLNVGENVYALGAPLGLDLSLSAGVISQLRKGKRGKYIQTDTAISPGSSGGGLFDSDGNLIGITTAVHADADAENIGFAIPADLAL